MSEQVHFEKEATVTCSECKATRPQIYTSPQGYNKAQRKDFRRMCSTCLRSIGANAPKGKRPKSFEKIREEIRTLSEVQRRQLIQELLSHYLTVDTASTGQGIVHSSGTVIPVIEVRIQLV